PLQFFAFVHLTFFLHYIINAIILLSLSCFSFRHITGHTNQYRRDSADDHAAVQGGMPGRMILA
ncbi:MAG: hypothetical protein IJP92_04535, partial [Lachnospiraceae bacterium]|nr:hypothetical protein [Lachnospiraceae bacterium]